MICNKHKSGARRFHFWIEETVILHTALQSSKRKRKRKNKSKARLKACITDVCVTTLLLNDLTICFIKFVIQLDQLHLNCTLCVHVSSSDLGLA